MALVLYGYHLWQDNRHLREELALRHAQTAQNEAAVRDSLYRALDSVQTMSVRVGDLNGNLVHLSSEYRVLLSKYRILVASVRDTAYTVPTDGQDSTGAYRQVDFRGVRGIVHYSGFTRAYITPLSTAMWSVAVELDTIVVQSTLVFDGDTKLFRVRTESRTPGVVLIGYTVLDSLAYPVLYRMEAPTATPVGWFYVGGQVSRDYVALGLVLRFKDWLISFTYQMFNRMLIESQPWYDRAQLGVYYSLF